MAYSTRTPPFLVTQTIGTHKEWVYKTNDPIETVRVSGYFTNGYSVGIRKGDSILVVDQNLGINTLVNVTSSDKVLGVNVSDGLNVTNGGGGSIPFPAAASHILRISPNDENAVITTVSQEFSPSDVITADNRIDVSGISYVALSTFAGGEGTRVQFTTTGTLPSSLNTSDYYYLSPNGSGGYDVYPEYTESNKSSLAANLDNQFVDENALPGQNLAQLQNKITFSDQGTGTHTIVSRPLLKTLTNMIDGGLDVGFDITSSDLHDRFELITSGGKYAILNETKYRDPDACGQYDRYGYGTDMTGTQVTAWNDLVCDKRTLALTMVVEPKEVNDNSIFKTPILATNVNTTTGVLTYDGSDGDHRQNTGRKVQIRVNAGGTIPTGFTAGDVTSQGVTSGTTYFVRDVSATTLTLHTSSADAGTGANPVIPSDQGTGGFTVLDIQGGGDRERMRFPGEIRIPSDPANNIIIPRTHNSFYASSTEFRFATDFVATGSNNGRVGAVGRTIDPLPNNNHLQAITGNVLDAGIGVVELSYPLGAIPATRTDTGQYLAEGTYYVTDDPQSSVFARLHDTIQDARDAVGQNTADSTTHITYSAVGEGFCRFEQAQLFPFSIDTEEGENLIMWSPLNNEKAVYTFIVDYNDPVASHIKYYVYKNGEKVVDFVTDLTKGKTAATGSSNSIFTLLNSPQGHVPYEGYLFDMLMHASDDAYDEDQILLEHTYYQSEYGIS